MSDPLPPLQEEPLEAGCRNVWWKDQKYRQSLTEAEHSSKGIIHWRD